VVLCGCDDSDPTAPTPPDLVRQVEGADFRAASRVLWDGIPLTTTSASESRLVARIPAAFVGQPLVAAISVETVLASLPVGHPRSGTRPFQVLPRPLASIHLNTAGNHVFSGQTLDYDIVMRDDLGEEVSRPGLGFSIDDDSVVGYDWMGNLIRGLRFLAATGMAVALLQPGEPSGGRSPVPPAPG
jgi:hypothetical protein